MKKILILFLLITSLHSNSQSIRKYSNDFLNIGVDASALGMSNAVTANTDNVNACYWNPAGLINLEDSQIAAMHGSYFANIAQYDFLAYAKPIDDLSAWGFSAIRFGVDDILNTTQLIDNQSKFPIIISSILYSQIEPETPRVCKISYYSFNDFCIYAISQIGQLRFSRIRKRKCIICYRKQRNSVIIYLSLIVNKLRGIQNIIDTKSNGRKSPST